MCPEFLRDLAREKSDDNHPAATDSAPARLEFVEEPEIRCVPGRDLLESKLEVDSGDFLFSNQMEVVHSP
ncbi:hypothetical protein J6590_075858 [Homalodisca vitripennis]|nr:hypothetical protein J6590_075858 [Homalodisca vitripennis]